MLRLEEDGVCREGDRGRQVEEFSRKWAPVRATGGSPAQILTAWSVHPYQEKFLQERVDKSTDDCTAGGIAGSIAGGIAVLIGNLVDC